MSGINFEVYGSIHVAVVAMIRGQNFVKTVEVDESFHHDGCISPDVEVGKYCPECGLKNIRGGKRTRRVINPESLPCALIEAMGDCDEWCDVHKVDLGEGVSLGAVEFFRDNPQPYLYVALRSVEVSSYPYDEATNISYDMFAMPDVDDVVDAVDRVTCMSESFGLDVYECRVALVQRG